MEARSVAGAVEALVLFIQTDRAAEVRAVDGKAVELPVVLHDEAAERQVACRVVTSAVGHDERGVGACRGIELNRPPVLELLDRLVECDREESLLLALGRRRPQIEEKRGAPDDDGGGHQGGSPPAKKGA